MHGHGGLRKYLVDKFHYTVDGYNLNRYLKLLTQTLPSAMVVIYGHTHFPEILPYRGKLLFNPGSASFGINRHYPPSVGLLRIFSGQRYSAEIALLEGYQLENGHWQAVKAENA